MEAHLITRGAGVPGAWIDEQGEAHRRYGITGAGYYLIRPDGHVALRAPGVGPEPLACIGYTLLRLAAPDQLPCILLWE